MVRRSDKVITAQRVEIVGFLLSNESSEAEIRLES